jgi:hypothetical protein
MITDPNQAFVGYNLTDQEREELTHPSSASYGLLSPGEPDSSRGSMVISPRAVENPPPVTITTTANTMNTTTITVNTINVTTTTTTRIAFNPYNFFVNDALRILGNNF